MTSSHPLDDRAVEAFIAGSTDGSDDLAPLATFADDLRLSASGPAPQPYGLLLRMVTEGISTEKGDLPATAASNVPMSIESGPAPQVAGLPKWRKRMGLAELLAGLAAKLAGLGMAAKAALGLGVAAASVTGIGSTGVLPDPVQHAVASVVNAATPLQLPDPGGAVSLVDDVTDVVDETTTTTTSTLPGGGDDEGTDGEGAAATNHGACVSGIARDKSATIDGNHGQAVSEAARSDCGKTEDDEETTTTTESPTTTTTALTGFQAEGNGGRSNGNGGQGGNSASHRP